MTEKTDQLCRETKFRKKFADTKEQNYPKDEYLNISAQKKLNENEANIIQYDVPKVEKDKLFD